MSKHKPPELFDKRLLGTWQSDRRRTFLNWKPDPSLTASQIRRYKGLFGKMSVRYTRKFAYIDTWFDFHPGPEPTQERIRYQVVAKDARSVVIRVAVTDSFKDVTGEDLLRQIYFDGQDGYHIFTEGIPEYFRRADGIAR
jgi:hypothetical protein